MCSQTCWRSHYRWTASLWFCSAVCRRDRTDRRRRCLRDAARVPLRLHEYWRLIIGMVDHRAGSGFSTRHRRLRARTLEALLEPSGEEGVTLLQRGFVAVWRRQCRCRHRLRSRSRRAAGTIGPNGAGKSTCFNMLNGQLRPDAGSIALDGRPIAALPPRAIWRLGVGRTFQITATFTSMTVLENVQTVLLSYHGRLRSLLPWSSKPLRGRGIRSSRAGRYG